MKRTGIIVSEEQLIKKLFKRSEIRSIDHVNYIFIKRKKVAVYVPQEAVEKVTFAMAEAGAGKIGNYDVCSFRINGTGTYKPNAKASPYKGRKNKIEHADEIKLEMECDVNALNAVIDSMLEEHPYEETAYEIYDFTKRTNRTNGIIVHLKRSLEIRDLVLRLNKKLDDNTFLENERTNRLGIIEDNVTPELMAMYKDLKADHLLIANKENFNLNKIA